MPRLLHVHNVVQIAQLGPRSIRPIVAVPIAVVGLEGVDGAPAVVAVHLGRTEDF